ncbi:hypothetical protein [Dactylosporangium sp. NPDC000521]|uniref:hypothetical protein n=1 Tax=Dactylosporangium sp. NPDC000521 TaxID=3363975 RepID=UPI00367C1281
MARAATGIWVGASYALGRDVPVDGPYPHICGINLTSRHTRERIRLRRIDCAACTLVAAAAEEEIRT